MNQRTFCVETESNPNQFSSLNLKAVAACKPNRPRVGSSAFDLYRLLTKAIHWFPQYIKLPHISQLFAGNFCLWRFEKMCASFVYQYNTIGYNIFHIVRFQTKANHNHWSRFFSQSLARISKSQPQGLKGNGTICFGNTMMRWYEEPNTCGKWCSETLVPWGFDSTSEQRKYTCLTSSSNRKRIYQIRLGPVGSTDSPISLHKGPSSCAVKHCSDEGIDVVGRSIEYSTPNGSSEKCPLLLDKASKPSGVTLMSTKHCNNSHTDTSSKDNFLSKEETVIGHLKHNGDRKLQSRRYQV